MAKKRVIAESGKILVVSSLVFFLLIYSVFQVSIGKYHMRSKTDLKPYIDKANVVTKTEQALRGVIYDRNGNVLAQDNRTYDIICVLKERLTGDKKPAYVKDKEHTAEVLSSILGISKEELRKKFNQKIYQTELGVKGRNLSKATKEKIDEAKLPGIEFRDSIKRVYPNGQFATNLIGYAVSDTKGNTVGKMGLEMYLNNYLTGENGSIVEQRDKNGYVLPGMKQETKAAVNGNNVTLTLDSGIQNTLEESMKQTMKNMKAEAVWGAAMEIDTGRVVAWGQSNSFNPNTLENIKEYSNFGMQMPYEPGSTMKSFTWAAAMNESKYNGEKKAEGNKWCFTSDNKNNPVRSSESNSYGCIYNARRRQWNSQSLDSGLIHSLNTIAATILTEYINPTIYLEYLKKFHFFQNVDTDGIPETATSLNYNYPGDKVALSFGQGSTVTLIQLLQAYTALTGNGELVKPYFVESIKDAYDSSKVIYQAKKTVVGKPIKAETAKQIQKVMTQVVHNKTGSAKYYQIPNVKLMGKTGTTQVAEKGSYDTGKTISSFMCAMPAENPKVLVYYAFKGPDNLSAHVDVEPQKAFLRKVAMTYGFSDKTVKSSEQKDKGTQLIQSTMPNVVNHSLPYAKQQLKSSKVNLLVLGEGQSVISQYPLATHRVLSNEKVFLVMDKNQFNLPDLRGWSRKEIESLRDVTGLNFVVKGNGVVLKQSVPANSVVHKNDKIEIQLGT
ncbi:penicillin-binding protein [Bulleidia sp. zg-1006]|uniref:penicillin-binding protein n=1 Tax=Bulleidia sp. zg-1006 TaxID=2806552 RepID=UPI001EEDE1FF|nr:penicillin-binding protein [Bulleidia sp. zg-1006]